MKPIENKKKLINKFKSNKKNTKSSNSFDDLHININPKTIDYWRNYNGC